MKKLKALFSYIVARFKEPSSWASISVLLVAANVNVDPGLWQLITGVGVAAAALLGYFLPEGQPK